MDAALVFHPVLSNHGPGPSGASEGAFMRSPERALEEAVGLVAAINIEVVDAQIVPVARPRPATLFGTGKLDEIKLFIQSHERQPTLVIVDYGLTPVQHRNLETFLEVKVLDRTALILEIFGARAQTAEGRLQVDLAHLTYQRSRLVRSWTHLERQRGGAGFLGGPGERQIESDRRVLADKIVRLNRKLDNVRRTRTLQRAKRKRAPQPVIALIGYTNAGKSTLFNTLTQSSVKAQDLLFATLDPTMRMERLPSGQEAIFSDTVGFISDLPTQLVAAFSATLEEVLEADLIIHVRDVAHEDSEAQRRDVLSVLEELGIDIELSQDSDTALGRPVIEALNKVDLLDEEEKRTLMAGQRLSAQTAERTAQDPVKVAISALTGEGLEQLFTLADEILTADRLLYKCFVPVNNGAAHAFLHAKGDVMHENTLDDVLEINVRLTEKTRGQFQSQFDIGTDLVTK